MRNVFMFVNFIQVTTIVYEKIKQKYIKIKVHC